MKSQLRARNRAFTLIELLTVIAIIAILAAIIFPVFGAVRENARRTSCMSNMMQISSALKQYELDNRKYPDFLFAPALKADGNGCALAANGKPIIATGSEQACTPEQASATGKLGGDFVDGNGNVVASGGLYPEYVKSLNTYLCPNNSLFLATGDKQFGTASPGTRDYPVTAPVPIYNAGTLNRTTPATFNDSSDIRYYKFDSYDSNPAVIKNGNGAATPRIDLNNWIVRYQRQWTPVVADPSTVTNPTDKRLYQNQLIWKNPGDDAIVTMCTHHVEKGKVIVLTLGGTAKVLDITRLKEQAATSDSTRDFDTYRMNP